MILVTIAGGFALCRLSGDIGGVFEGGGWESEMGGGGLAQWGTLYWRGMCKACIHVARAGDDSRDITKGRRRSKRMHWVDVRGAGMRQLTRIATRY